MEAGNCPRPPPEVAGRQANGCLSPQCFCTPAGRRHPSPLTIWHTHAVLIWGVGEVSRSPSRPRTQPQTWETLWRGLSPPQSAAAAAAFLFVFFLIHILPSWTTLTLSLHWLTFSPEPQQARRGRSSSINLLINQIGEQNGSWPQVSESAAL